MNDYVIGCLLVCFYLVGVLVSGHFWVKSSREKPSQWPKEKWDQFVNASVFSWISVFVFVCGYLVGKAKALFLRVYG